MRTEDHGRDRGWYHHLAGLLVLPNNQAAAAAPIPDSHDWFRQSSRSRSLALALLPSRLSGRLASVSFG